MKIKSVEITGFKSFMETTVFPLDHGITAVVGPNGCGKSNLVDAIRWALGEQSAKHLRGMAMDDVIFNGSESYSPLSMGEVTLTFRNDDGQVAEAYRDYVEISVTRRLFRSGESDYLINKVPVRLKDVTELFLGTGVGTKAYSIIEQGRVGLIVSSKAEERRALIEEAAGVSKYRMRKRAAERKMDATRQNLQRVQDVLGEVRRQVGALERQAKKAERFKRLRDEARGLEMRSAAHEALRIMAEGSLVLEQAGETRERMATNQAGLAAREADVASARLAVTECDRELQDVNRRLYEVDNEAKLFERDHEHIGKEIEAAERRAADVAGELESAGAAERNIQSELAETEAQNRTCRAEHDSAALELSIATESVAGIEGRWAEIEASIDELRSGEARANEAIVRAKSQIGAVERQQTELGIRLEGLAGAETAEVREGDAQTSVRDRIRSQVNGLRQLRLELGGKEDELKGRLEALDRTIAERDGVLRQRWSHLSERKSRLEALVAIYDSHEGVNEGARRLLGRGAAGVVGLVADLIDVPSGLESAVAAALGPRLEYIVVESERYARTMIDDLRASEGGRAGFVIAGARRVNEAATTLPPGWSSLPDVVKFRDAVEALGRESILVERLPDREALAEPFARCTFVTRAGDLSQAGGILLGGSGMEAAAGLLVRKREIRELRGAVATLNGEYDVLKGEHARDQRERAELAALMTSVRDAVRVRDQDLSKEERELARLDAAVSQHAANLGRIQAERRGVEQRIGELVAQLEVECQTLATAENARRERQSELREAMQSEEVVRAEVEEARERTTTCRVTVTALTERRESLARDLTRLSAALTEASDRLARAAAERVRLGDLLEKSGGRLIEVERLLTDARRRSAELAEVCVGADVALSSAVKVEQEAELVEREIRAAMDGERASLNDLVLRQSQLVLERRQLVDSLATRWRANLEHAVQEFHAAPLLGGDDRSRMTELAEAMERMGEVNLAAMDEFSELQKRQEFLTTQKDDLENSLATLARAIAKINRTSRERFRETFELVNQRFQEVFPRLFRGGRAKLVLTNEDDMLETGVDIVAQPPGRKLQHLSLLSGGEKALTAVSLLFALFLVRPTPFCLLDEVDAPLDQANVDRFSTIVREMSVNVQFILITHNRATMEIADRLIGITMEEPGVSKLVSVELKREATLALAG